MCWTVLCYVFYSLAPRVFRWSSCILVYHYVLFSMTNHSLKRLLPWTFCTFLLQELVRIWIHNCYVDKLQTRAVGNTHLVPKSLQLTFGVVVFSWVWEVLNQSTWNSSASKHIGLLRRHPHKTHAKSSVCKVLSLPVTGAATMSLVKCSSNLLVVAFVWATF